MHLVSSAFTLRQLSLLATNKTSVFTFMIRVLSVMKYKGTYFRCYYCIKSMRQPTTLHCNINFGQKIYYICFFLHTSALQVSLQGGCAKSPVLVTSYCGYNVSS
jgi:hypothetical protein